MLCGVVCAAGSRVLLGVHVCSGVSSADTWGHVSLYPDVYRLPGRIESADRVCSPARSPCAKGGQGGPWPFFSIGQGRPRAAWAADKHAADAPSRAPGQGSAGALHRGRGWGRSTAPGRGWGRGPAAACDGTRPRLHGPRIRGTCPPGTGRYGQACTGPRYPAGDPSRRHADTRPRRGYVAQTRIRGLAASLAAASTPSLSLLSLSPLFLFISSSPFHPLPLFLSLSSSSTLPLLSFASPPPLRPRVRGRRDRLSSHPPLSPPPPSLSLWRIPPPSIPTSLPPAAGPGAVPQVGRRLGEGGGQHLPEGPPGQDPVGMTRIK
jgi:hypothetical protein